MNVSIKSCIRSSIRIGSFGSISDIFRHLCPLSLQWWQMSPGRFLNRHFDLKALITRGFSLFKSLLPLSIDSIHKHSLHVGTWWYIPSTNSSDLISNSSISVKFCVTSAQLSIIAHQRWRQLFSRVRI